MAVLLSLTSLCARGTLGTRHSTVVHHIARVDTALPSIRPFITLTVQLKHIRTGWHQENRKITVTSYEF